MRSFLYILAFFTVIVACKNKQRTTESIPLAEMAAPAAPMMETPPPPPAPVTGWVDLVNPFIGTDAHGHTFPGVTRPFGMVQLSPDTRIDGWDGCGGYHYSDSIIYGFSHTHLQGTGVSDYGDILMMPNGGKRSSGVSWKDRFQSRFSHDYESAHPQRYTVALLDHQIDVLLTATPHVGIHQYLFNNCDSTQVFLDLSYRDQLKGVNLQVHGDTAISGYRISNAWATEQHCYFYATFSSPIKKVIQLPALNGEKNRNCYLITFAKQKELKVKVGISGTDVDGARKNLYTEAPHWDFNAYVRSSYEAWKEVFKKDPAHDARVQNPFFPIDEQEKIVYATAVYHCYTVPNIWSDVDGRYRGEDNQIHVAKDYQRYTVFSLWDTFRAYHPLMADREPERTLDWIKTFLAIYQERKELPVWELAGNETYCMIGYHSVPVIYDAYMRGIRNFDTALALEAMIASANGPQEEKKLYLEKGYVPGNLISESVSKTLEFAYDDWCIAQFAKAIGNEDVYRDFLIRSQSWKNMYDPETQCMRPRRNGGFPEPFDKYQVDFNYTEANAYQYSLFVLHDFAELTEYMGGSVGMRKWIEEMLVAPSQTTGREQADITGLIGQYAHGNEPSHHVPALYYKLDPLKGYQFIKRIQKEFYTTQPDGLCGNEDCGQMSAWYVMICNAKYSLCPGTPDVSLMSPPTSFTANRDFRITPIPAIQGPTSSFIDSTVIRIRCADPKATVYYSITLKDGKPSAFIPYEGPFTLKKSATVQAYAERDGFKRSRTEEAQFVKRNNDRRVVSISKYDNQYTAGGDDALIDGLRGSKDFRTGNWQGFWKTNAEVVVELNTPQRIQRLSLTCYQEIRPWIWMPAKVVYYGGNDLNEMKLLGEVKAQTPQDLEGVFIENFYLELKDQPKYKYIKAVAYPAFQTIPAWHLGAGGQPWIFVDEFTIE